MATARFKSALSGQPCKVTLKKAELEVMLKPLDFRDPIADNGR